MATNKVLFPVLFCFLNGEISLISSPIAKIRSERSHQNLHPHGGVGGGRVSVHLPPNHTRPNTFNTRGGCLARREPPCKIPQVVGDKSPFSTTLAQYLWRSTGGPLSGSGSEPRTSWCLSVALLAVPTKMLDSFPIHPLDDLVLYLVSGEP